MNNARFTPIRFLRHEPDVPLETIGITIFIFQE